MNSIQLPALRADRVVGYLGALGLLRLLDSADCQLSWPEGGGQGAVLVSSSLGSLDDVANALFEIVERMRHNDESIPGVARLPLRGEKSDPMNSLSFIDCRGLAQTHQTDSAASEWLSSMVGLGAFGVDGTAKRSRWWAVGPGPVTIDGTLKKARDAVATREDFVSALTDWRRHDWVGGYLDVSADVGKERIAGTRASDASKSAIVGTTWLALMATPWFPERLAVARSTETVGWRVQNRKTLFRYWVWARPLGPAAVRAMVDFPQPTDDKLRALGVTEVWECERLRSGNNNAAVTHPRQVWSGL